jgi:DNA ligase 1
MPYFELVSDKASKFWEIHNYWNEDRQNVYVRWGKIGKDGTEKRFYYHDSDWGYKFVEKKIEEKVKKGYVEKYRGKRILKEVSLFTDKKKKKSLKPTKTAKKCPIGKVLNPATGRCINAKVSPKKKTAVKKQVVKKQLVNKSTKKKCPIGKVLNPATGRCINAKVSPKKKISIKKSVAKKCPKGKVLNPATGRCINAKVSPKKKTSVKKPTPVVKKPKLVVKKTKGKALWDIKKQGVMLAHTFKDPASGKIRTAPKGCEQAPKGWYLSEKYDGYRAIWDGKDFRSRAGNIFAAPEWFKDWLPRNNALDGELFMGRECFEKCGIFRKKVPDDEEWKKANVTYQIFDAPTVSGPFEKRMEEVKKIIAKQCKVMSGKCPLKMTKQIKVKDEVDVSKHFDKLVKKGAEGVMLRAPGSPYDSKRSSYLLKVKQLFDDECKIIGYKKGSGKYADMLGAFECQMVKNPKVKFHISGMDDKIRQNYKKTHPLGTTVTFTYMGLSTKGVPRHPNYLRIRK